MSGNFDIQLKTLQFHATKQDVNFLNNPDNKRGIIKLIKKNKLNPSVIEYIWSNSKYKNEIIKKQTLPTVIREDIIHSCQMSYSTYNWATILRNFIKFHSPTDEEYKKFLTSYRSNLMILELWNIVPRKCYELGGEEALYKIMLNNEVRTQYALKRLHYLVVEIMKYVPEMHLPLIETIINVDDDSFTTKFLSPVFKATTVSDEAVNFLLKNLKTDTFKEIVKNAMRRGNISDIMLAKIYLAID